ncbi:hypothetical protein ACD591_05455 [Rufibacter glacialis]|uniref:Uncharacterized protein n=1 Tax=Rufibacter glacialis TaxID=1259555 RepID=A0A5M8QI64_9BACT|nr:hypothetical protein [Rufibacter glacialis]KAA6434791.1 hypothetical protein FOE74_11510 [Rufibacter glacialis]GGK72461.1 hypothetical protein GCM10011405_20870 [Rufibacter glacialis]
MWDVYIYFGLLILSIGLWASCYGRLATGLKVLGFALLLNLGMEGYAAYLMFQLKRNLYMYHLLIPIQYTLYTLVFYFAFHRPKVKQAALASIPAYLLAVMFILVSLQVSNEYNSLARSLKNVLLAAWALFYYTDVFKGLMVQRLEKEPMFWISTGFLFYSLGNFFVDGLMNHILEQSYELGHTLYFINVVLGLLLNVTILISFALARKQTSGNLALAPSP